MKRFVIITIVVCLLGTSCCAALSMLVVRFIQTEELNQAARAGDLDRVKHLLAYGSAINGMGWHGMRPLMSACEGGDFDTVKFLIEQGANVNAHNDSGSALMWAIESGNAEVVELLLQSHVDVTWISGTGQDALDFAKEKGDDRIIELMLSKRPVVPVVESK